MKDTLLENGDQINKNSTDFCCSRQLRSEIGLFHRSLLYTGQNLPNFCWFWCWCHMCADCMNLVTEHADMAVVVRQQSTCPLTWTLFYSGLGFALKLAGLGVWKVVSAIKNLKLCIFILRTYMVPVNRGERTNQQLHHILSWIEFPWQSTKHYIQRKIWKSM